MTIEIIDVTLQDRILTIEAIDCSEEYLQYMERRREDGFEQIVTFAIDTKLQDNWIYLQRWMHKQKATQRSEVKTWGDAMRAIVGTIVESPRKKYRVWV